MQIQLNNVGGSERPLREIGQEEFVDDTLTRDANGTLLLACGMRCHDHAVRHALWPYWDLRTIVEATHHLAFGTLLKLIGGRCRRAWICG